MRHEVIAPASALLARQVPAPWRGPLVRLVLGAALLLALFAGTWAQMAWLWWDSSTYNHILLVPLIIGWLVWNRAPELARLVPSAWWPGLVPLAGALLLWLAGEVSGLASASHLGAVAMPPATVLLLLGPRVAMALAFPLFYCLFLVPVGDELVPALQMMTAAITIWLTEASGIPAVIDGVFIDTPVGLFEVAEACSGVKFLVAMVALGALVAHVCFRSWRRRAIFMAVAVILPILANGVRAWGTIWIAQSQGIAFAQGFDHIVYGWVFFAVVLAMLLGLSWRFFDREPDAVVVDVKALQASPLLARLEGWSAGGWVMLAALAVLAIGVQGWACAARAVEAPLPQQVVAPAVPGWEIVAAAPSYPWRPEIPGADRLLRATYRDEAGREVDMVLALYGAQEDGREAGSAGEGALPPNTEWRWLAAAPSIAGARGERLQALGTIQRTAMTWFRHDGWSGGSRMQLKLHTMRDRVLLRERVTAMLILSSEHHGGHDGQATLADFHAAIGDEGEWIDHIAGLR